MPLLDRQEFLFSVFFLCVQQLAAFRSSSSVRKMKSGGFVWEEKRERRNRFAEGNTTEKRQVHCSNAFGKYLQVILDHVGCTGH